MMRLCCIDFQFYSNGSFHKCRRTWCASAVSVPRRAAGPLRVGVARFSWTRVRRAMQRASFTLSWRVVTAGSLAPVDTKALCSAIQHPPRHPLIRLKTEDADPPGLTSSEQVTLAGAARGRCWAWLGQQGLDGFWARGSGTEGQPPGKVKWLRGRIIHDLIPDPLLLTHIRDRP